MTGGDRTQITAASKEVFTSNPLILKGNNKMRVFQEEIFGPVVAVTSFKDYADAIGIANYTLYGLGAGVRHATAT